MPSHESDKCWNAIGESRAQDVEAGGDIIMHETNLHSGSYGVRSYFPFGAVGNFSSYLCLRR
jgi:hypothetical protein